MHVSHSHMAILMHYLSFCFVLGLYTGHASVVRQPWYHELKVEAQLTQYHPFFAIQATHLKCTRSNAYKSLWLGLNCHVMYCDVFEIVFIGIFPGASVAAVGIHELESKINVDFLILKKAKSNHSDSNFRTTVPSTDKNAAIWNKLNEDWD